MRHKKSLLILAFLARFSIAEEKNVGFVFNESHFLDMRGILNSSIASDGRIMEPRPVPIVFAERHGITQEQLGEAIVAFAKGKDRAGEYAIAAKALGKLSHSPETNSIPYLVECILDKEYRQVRGPLLYTLLYKAPERFAMVVKQLVWDAFFDDVFEENERYEVYALMLKYCRLAHRGFSGATMAGEETLLRCLRELADFESYDRPRWWIDHTLCDHLDGWMFSEDRIRLLREWEKTRTSQDERFNWSRIADETEEAIRTGNTAWILYKDRPRPPKPPLNPDGSLAVPKGQEHLLNQDDGIPPELKATVIVDAPSPPPIDDDEVPKAAP